MRITDTLKKAAGLFIEFPDHSGSASIDAPATGAKSMSDADFLKMMQAQQGSSAQPAGATTVKTVEQIVKESPGPNLDQIKVPANQTQMQALQADGTVDFKAIYGLANVQDA